MGTVSIFIATSLDGYIADRDNSLNWLFSDEDYGYEEYYKEVDSIIMGRNTYESIKNYEWPYRGKISYIITHEENMIEDDIIFTQKNPEHLIKELHDKKDGKIWIVGGSDVISQVLRKDLMDEIILSIHPIILGDGIQLFKNNMPKRELELISDIRYKTGLIQLKYLRRRI